MIAYKRSVIDACSGHIAPISAILVDKKRKKLRQYTVFVRVFETRTRPNRILKERVKLE